MIYIYIYDLIMFSNNPGPFLVKRCPSQSVSYVSVIPRVQPKRNLVLLLSLPSQVPVFQR